MSTFESGAELKERKASEIVIGLVGALGTDFDMVCGLIEAKLKQFDYRTKTWRLSEYIRAYQELAGVRLDETSEYMRLKTYMDGGDELRHLGERDKDSEGKRTQAPEGKRTRDILACLAAVDIADQRKGTAQPSVAHLLRSLKRKEEVDTLRSVYGLGFYLIGIYTPEKERLDYLRHVKNLTEGQARELMERDEQGEEPWGQNTRQTFVISDFFLNASRRASVMNDLGRFFDLVFGHQYISPEPDEHAMFLAHAASMRSLALSRQVGACVTSPNHDVLAVGTNEVPSPGGGQYWPGEYDQRDHKWRPQVGEARDSNDAVREVIVDDVVKRVAKVVGAEYRDRLVEEIDRSRIERVTEYGRVVHAEMEALLSCARSGVSPVGGTLFTTLFPCHNCVRHIIAAGISRVVYLEPYPKSLAEDLHSDAISIDSEDSPCLPRKVRFQVFTGVAARRYIDLFSMNLGWGYRFENEYSRKHEIEDPHRRGYVREPNREVRVKMQRFGYVEAEEKLATDTMKLLESPQMGGRRGHEGPS
ncbi:MAG: anti-phage dCTP deaminase [Acidobacteriota bacterium]